MATMFKHRFRARTDRPNHDHEDVICDCCQRRIAGYASRYYCCAEDCQTVMCPLCFSEATHCEICHRNMCDEHIEVLGGLDICTECASDPEVLESYAALVYQQLLGEIEAFHGKTDRLTNQYGAVAGRMLMLCGRLVVP